MSNAIIQLFEFQNGTVIPSVHCYTLKTLKVIQEKYPTNFIKVYLYLFYMTHPDPTENPFFHMDEADKEELILKEVSADFSTDDDIITDALEFCTTLYDTPTHRAYIGIKSALDKMGKFMRTSSITSGRDGNGMLILKMAKEYDDVRKSFKGVEKDYMDEVKAIARGGTYTSYDMQ